MRLNVRPDVADSTTRVQMASELAEALRGLGFDAHSGAPAPGDTALALASGAQAGPGQLAAEPRATLLERALQRIPLDFNALPLLVEGESKIVREWTSQVVVTRLKPTVYSYTHNRYGVAPGTDAVRARFSAQVFRRLDLLAPQDGCAPRSAFLAEIPTRQGPLLVERRVVPCNLEVRIKRYHIGSPLHRYRYTERYPSTQRCGPVGRWSRFDTPVVCFDWRHPLHDDQGQRLADEPISDDYARVWMEDVGYAKAAARHAFVWLEGLFERAELRLVDMCLIVDRSGRTIYGEISPDCMRVRLDLSDPALSPAGAKDVWRAGGSAEALLHNYQECYRRLFGEA